MKLRAEFLDVLTAGNFFVGVAPGILYEILETLYEVFEVPDNGPGSK